MCICFCVFKQKTAYEMRISDWSSDVCSSDLSPYDNLAKRAYPAMFIGTGLWDSQVQYWEPAKYVARLRDVDSGGQTIVFRTNMDAGHGGKSGRFRRYRARAEMYAFMLDQFGEIGRAHV